MFTDFHILLVVFFLVWDSYLEINENIYYKHGYPDKIAKSKYCMVILS